MELEFIISYKFSIQLKWWSTLHLIYFLNVLLVECEQGLCSCHWGHIKGMLLTVKFNPSVK